MVDIKPWLENFVKIVEDTFAERVSFIGIQGSYGRGEAKENSDIDVVVILDYLTMKDLQIYDAVISELPQRELICGFVSGKQELLNWEPSDLFQFYYDTAPVKGDLDGLLSLIRQEDVKRAVRIGACNIYHACVHNIVHEKSPKILSSLYKSARFVLQAKYFYDTGRYIKNSRELEVALPPEDECMLSDGINIDCDGFDCLSEQLLNWSGNLIKNLG